MTGFRLWQIVGWTMLHYIWIGAALGAAVLFARQRLHRASANARYCFALGSLLLLSIAPAPIAFVVNRSIPPAEHGEPLTTDTAIRPEAMPLMTAMADTADASVPATTADLPAEAPQEWTNERLLAALNLAAMCLPWLWVCGAPLSFALTTAGLLGAERLRRHSRLLEDARITEMCRHLAAALKISRRVSVAICDRIAAPILVGVFRPMILLPASVLAGWDPQQLEMILLHELAHVRRYDNLVNLLQRIAESLLFFQPMVWIVSGWVRREREHCCDELVVARTRQPHAYAEILVALAEKFSQSSLRSSSLAHPQMVSSMAERPLVARIRRILKKEEQSMQVSRKAVGLVFVGILALAAMIVGYYSLPSYAEESATPPASEKTPAADAPAVPSTKVSAEQPKPVDAKENKPSGKTPTEKPATENKPAEDLTYKCQVTDRKTGKPIAGASVTVLRRVSNKSLFETWPKLGETKHQTDAEGRYTFTVPPNQAAEGSLYIETTAEHPDYVRFYGGYSFHMLRRNETLGERPFFEALALEPAEKISGTIVTPEEKPAAGVAVRAISTYTKDGFGHSSWAECKTDDEGRFQINVVVGGEAVFWILPKDYAPSTHPASTKRGDFGRFVLEKGLVLKGRVLDVDGKPLSNVWVNAEIHGGPAKQEINMAVFDHLMRSALSNEAGEFIMAPLPAGEYSLIVSDHTRGGLVEDKTTHPLPAVFLSSKITLDQAEPKKSIEIRAVPHVVVEGQFVDSSGKPTSGFAPNLRGFTDDAEQKFWFTDTQIDEHGKFAAKAPKGIKAKLSLHDNEHHALRTRVSKDAALSNDDPVELGTLDKDKTDIEVVRYAAPILLVKATDDDGKPIKGFQAKIKYMPGQLKDEEFTLNGKPYGDVGFERQNDGRWRTSQLLPDEEFTLQVGAEGYEPKSEKVKLSEGVEKELVVKLKKNLISSPPAPLPKGEGRSAQRP